MDLIKSVIGVDIMHKGIQMIVILQIRKRNTDAITEGMSIFSNYEVIVVIQCRCQDINEIPNTKQPYKSNNPNHWFSRLIFMNTFQ